MPDQFIPEAIPRGCSPAIALDRCHRLLLAKLPHPVGLVAPGGGRDASLAAHARCQCTAVMLDPVLVQYTYYRMGTVEP